MPYFFDALNFLSSGRLFTIWYTADRLWPAEEELVFLGQFVRLPANQLLDIESDFLTSHLPYRRAGFGGRDRVDDPWLFVVQAAPASGPHGNPMTAMKAAMDAALVYNAGAFVSHDFRWDRAALLDIYADRGVEAAQVEHWTTLDLLRGLLAEVAGPSLDTLVAGYPDCAFPGTVHACQENVFDDAITAWTQQRSA